MFTLGRESGLPRKMIWFFDLGAIALKYPIWKAVRYGKLWGVEV